jgi:hypothetical protein
LHSDDSDTAAASVGYDCVKERCGGWNGEKQEGRGGHYVKVGSKFIVHMIHSLYVNVYVNKR